ncbi:MAG: YbaY family lipoprotein [Pseudomonadota bacterium]
MKNALLLLPLLAGLAACETTRPKDNAAEGTMPAKIVSLSGTASYRERIALQADARLEVEIRDVSLMDAPAPLIAKVEIPTAGRQPPLAFTLNYDPARIVPRNRYAVSARITDGSGRLIWITDTHVDLPSPGKSVELNLVRVAG